MGIIDIFMPSRDGINRITIVSYVLNSKAIETRHQINKLFPIDNSQRKTLKCNRNPLMKEAKHAKKKIVILFIRFH